MASYKIVRPDGYPRQNHDMLALLGFKKLPDEGMAPFEVVGVKNFKRGHLNAEAVNITVWITPHDRSAEKRSMNGSRPHRFRCTCPGCGREFSVGRLALHVCKAGA